MDDDPISEAIDDIADGIGCVLSILWPFLWFFGVMIGIALLTLAFKMTDRFFDWVDHLTIVIDATRLLT